MGEDSYINFIETIADHLGQSTAFLYAGQSLRAVRALDSAVELCERNPSFAFCAHETLGPMRIVVEASIAREICRVDIGPIVAALFHRMQVLEQSALH